MKALKENTIKTIISDELSKVVDYLVARNFEFKYSIKRVMIQDENCECVWVNHIDSVDFVIGNEEAKIMTYGIFPHNVGTQLLWSSRLWGKEEVFDNAQSLIDYELATWWELLAK